MRRDVREGLSQNPRQLSPKYFYDDLGSALFEAITRLPEYYLTRVERDLLATYGSQIVETFNEPLELVELGSGSAPKTRLIIDAILARQDALTFHPIDISPEALIESSQALVASIDAVHVHAYAGDYFALLRAKRIETRDRVLALYRGSNVGNFEPPAARELFGLLGPWLKDWQPAGPITEMYVELPELEGAGRRQLRLWAGGDGSREEVDAALERLQERYGEAVALQVRPALLASPIPSQRYLLTPR